MRNCDLLYKAAFGFAFPIHQNYNSLTMKMPWYCWFSLLIVGLLALATGFYLTIATILAAQGSSWRPLTTIWWWLTSIGLLICIYVLKAFKKPENHTANVWVLTAIGFTLGGQTYFLADLASSPAQSWPLYLDLAAVVFWLISVAGYIGFGKSLKKPIPNEAVSQISELQTDSSMRSAQQ
jgi:cation transport ATPase